MYRAHSPNWAETEEVRLGNRIDRIFSHFQLNDGIVNKVNNNTQFSPLFVISAVIQITKSFLIFFNNLLKKASKTENYWRKGKSILYLFQERIRLYAGKDVLGFYCILALTHWVI